MKFSRRKKYAQKFPCIVTSMKSNKSDKTKKIISYKYYYSNKYY